jgi:hypothetical protein
MRHTTRIAALAAVILHPAPAAAQDSDVQFWATVTALARIDKTTTATIDLSQRQREGAVGGDVWLARASLDFTVARAVALGGGVTAIESSGPGEVRPHQQVTLTFGSLALRTRLEERFVDGAPRMGLRLRERVQYRLALGERDHLVTTVEALYALRQTSPMRRPGLQEWRFSIGDQHRLTKALELAASYLLIDARRPGLPDRISHVPQLTLIYRL